MKDCAGIRESFIPSAEQPFPDASRSTAISGMTVPIGGSRVTLLVTGSDGVCVLPGRRVAAGQDGATIRAYRAAPATKAATM